MNIIIFLAAILLLRFINGSPEVFGASQERDERIMQARINALSPGERVPARNRQDILKLIKSVEDLEREVDYARGGFDDTGERFNDLQAKTNFLENVFVDHMKETALLRARIFKLENPPKDLVPKDLPVETKKPFLRWPWSK